MPQIADAIRSMGLPDGVTKGLIAATGAAVGAAVGGAQGAASGFNQAANNYLKHEEDERKLKAKAECSANANPSQCRSEIEKTYNRIGRERQERKCTDAETCRANRDEITTDLQTTLTRQEKLEDKYYQDKQKLTEAETQEYISNSQQISKMNSALEEAQRQLRNVIPYDQWTKAEKEKAFSDSMAALGGLGAAAAAGQTSIAKRQNGKNSTAGQSVTAENFFDGTKYTPKVLQQAASGDYHAFPQSVDALAKDGTVTSLVGGDGVTRLKLTIAGEYNGQAGVFEYIRDPDGSINHRLFVPKK